MSDQSPTPLERVAERVTKLEELLTHLQQTLQDLSAVAVEQSQRLERIERGLAQMKSLYGELTASPAAERDSGLERPPHY